MHLTFFNCCSFPLFYVQLCEFSTFSTKRRLTFSKFEVFEFWISSMFESVIENEVDFQQSNRIIEKIRFSLKLDLCRDWVRRRFQNAIFEQQRSSLWFPEWTRVVTVVFFWLFSLWNYGCGWSSSQLTPFRSQHLVFTAFSESKCRFYLVIYGLFPTKQN